MDSSQSTGYRVNLTHAVDAASHEFTSVEGIRFAATLADASLMRGVEIETETQNHEGVTSTKLVARPIVFTENERANGNRRIGFARMAGLLEDVGTEFQQLFIGGLALLNGLVLAGIAYLFGDVRELMKTFSIFAILLCVCIALFEMTLLSRWNDKIFHDFSDVTDDWKVRIGALLFLALGLFLGISNYNQTKRENYQQTVDARDRAEAARISNGATRDPDLAKLIQSLRPPSTTNPQNNAPEPDYIQLAEEIKKRRDARVAALATQPSPTATTSRPGRRYPVTRSSSPPNPDR